MDIATALWLESKAEDNYWETSYRRSYTDRDWISDCYGVSEMFDGNENAWSDLGRHERLAEAVYET
tara:strand:+ start:826 stop:1023 length:198 start_codon:yes stop_codon:yes gene_type:complete